MSAVIELEGAVRTYRRGAEEIRAIDGMFLSVEEGDYVSIIGPSGSGKTTLLNLIGGVDRPTAGKVRLHGIELQNLTDKALAAIRSTSIGFIFQHFFLIPTLTAIENVMLPARFSARPVNGEEARAQELLDRMGMGDRAKHRPGQLSGGEMQRVAIARALINEPSILLADEPTGNLDSRRSEEIVFLLKELNESGLTVVVVTHNQDLANDSFRSIYLRDGRVDSDIRRQTQPVRLRKEARGADEVPEYMAGEDKRSWGPAIPALLAVLLASGLIASIFFTWYGGLTGYRFLTMRSYYSGLYQGNWLWRTYAGDRAILLTGFWPLLASLLIIGASVMGLLRWKAARWVLLAGSLVSAFVAAFNLVSIYTRLQPAGTNPPNFSGYFHAGTGMWILAASTWAVMIFTAWRLWSDGGRRSAQGRKRRRESSEADIMMAAEN